MSEITVQVISDIISILFNFILFSNLIGLVPHSFTATSHLIVTFLLSFLSLSLYLLNLPIIILVIFFGLELGVTLIQTYLFIPDFFGIKKFKVKNNYENK